VGALREECTGVGGLRCTVWYLRRIIIRIVVEGGGQIACLWYGTYLYVGSMGEGIMNALGGLFPCPPYLTIP
jgi:hypothetical protein